MEPFGLFNLLKSLLPQAENLPQNTTDTVDNNTPSAQSPTMDNEKTPPDFSNAPPNAFLDFVSRHDQRKKNMKK